MKMPASLQSLIRCVGLLIAAILLPTLTHADEVLFESVTLDNLGTNFGDVNAASVDEFVYTGVRFELDQPVETTAIGGHFVGSGSFFGALVALDSEDDVPDSGDLITPDVLGVVTADFPEPSAEVFADLSLSLQPGWYAIAFGSGLFGASGDGGIPVSDTPIGQPSYISGQQGAWFPSPNNTIQRRIVLLGRTVPEPTGLIMVLSVCLLQTRRR